MTFLFKYDILFKYDVRRPFYSNIERSQHSAAENEVRHDVHFPTRRQYPQLAQRALNSEPNFRTANLFFAHVNETRIAACLCGKLGDVSGHSASRPLSAAQ